MKLDIRRTHLNTSRHLTSLTGEPLRPTSNDPPSQVRRGLARILVCAARFPGNLQSDRQRGVEQGVCVGLLRVGEESFGWLLLDDLACSHDDDSVR